MRQLQYLSVCSGIEAATVAWHPLGWTPFGFAEIEAFPSAVLAHHYGSNMPGELWKLSNGVPNFGDMNNFKEWPDAAIDVLVGGTPCQSFSVAGLRKGLADPRGNLALTYLAIADRYRPEWLVWENVPGVLSSSEGRDFGAFIGGLAELGYHASWRVLDAQYVRVDGFGRAVPQRRRRVFVVGNSRDWRRSAAVLFEPESLSGNTAPRRQTGEGIAPTISSRPTGGGGLGTDLDCDGGLISVDVSDTLSVGANQTTGFMTEVVARSLNAHANRSDGESETFVAHTLRAKWDSGEDGTGRGTPIIPVVAASLTRGAESQGKGGYAGRRQEDDSNIVAFVSNQSFDSGDNVNVSPPLRVASDGAGNPPAVAFMENVRHELRISEVTDALSTGGGKPGQGYPAALIEGWAVRRLTPRECERLQGFPDAYTDVPYRSKVAADGPRYKALGNSMAVNAMRWLGRRIQMVDAISRPLTAEP